MSTRRYDHDQVINITLSNQTILILCTIGFASLGIIVYFLILRPLPPSTNDNANNEPPHDYDEFLNQSDVATLNRAERRARAKLHMKKARRAPTAPGRREDGDANDIIGARAIIGPEDGDDVPAQVVEDAALSRKERQRAAKALEREERKISAEIARVRREAEEKRKRTKPTLENSDCRDDNGNTPLRLDDIFLRREEGTNDPLCEYLFYESITRKYKNDPQSFLDNSIQTKKITIRTFIHNFQKTGSVSLAAMADEFGISIEDVCNELERLNEAHGIIGVVDKIGNFVYISIEMIEMAVELGRKMGKIPFPD